MRRQSLVPIGKSQQQIIAAGHGLTISRQGRILMPTAKARAKFPVQSRDLDIPPLSIEQTHAPHMTTEMAFVGEPCEDDL